MFLPVRPTRSQSIALANTACGMTHLLGQWCWAHQHDHEVIPLRLGPDSGLVAAIAQVNTVCATTCLMRRRAFHQQHQNLISRIADPGSIRASRAVQA